MALQGQRIVTATGRGLGGAARALEQALLTEDGARIVSLTSEVNRWTRLGRATVVAVVEVPARP